MRDKTEARCSDADREPWVAAILQELDWADSHADVLHPDFDGMWVALDGARVVVAAATFAAVQQEASRLLGRPPDEIAITFVEREDFVYRVTADRQSSDHRPSRCRRP